MKKRELKHWINNARQMLVGAEDLLAKADRECELPENDLDFLDKLVTNVEDKMFEIDRLIGEMRVHNEVGHKLERADNNIKKCEEMFKC